MTARRSGLWTRLLSCGLAILLGLPARGAEPPLPAPRILVQELPPFVYNRRGKPEGFIPDVLEALAAQLGLATPLAMEFAPLPRAVEFLRRHPNTIFAPIARVPGNEGDFKWLRPLVQSRVYAYRRTANTPLATDIEALKDRKLAVSTGGAHQALAREAGFRNLLPVRSQVDAFRRMMAGDAEYCLMSDLAMAGIVEAEKVPLDAVQATTFVLGETEVHLAFSPATPPQLLARWHDALEQLRRTGRLQALARQHFGATAQVPR